MVLAKPMTIGQLARRTGVPIKALREYEQLGLIYTLGRSESNYRLFDEEALWCVQVIRTMRSLGLTLKEIQDLTALYLERPGEPIGPHLGEKLEGALTRIEAGSLICRRCGSAFVIFSLLTPRSWQERLS